MREWQDNCIEVYEWKEGDERPGINRGIGGDCIEALAMPPAGLLPCAGDIVVIANTEMPEEQTRYRVVEREFLWGSSPADNSGAGPFVKAWLLVRRAD